MLLDQAFGAVKSFKTLNEAEVGKLISKTQEVARNGKYELFKTTSHFDTTSRHPDWLGTDSEAVQKAGSSTARMSKSAATTRTVRCSSQRK